MSIRFCSHLEHQTNKILAILFKIKEYRDTNFKSSCTSEVRKSGKVNLVGVPAKMFVGGCSKGKKSLRRTTERHRKNKQTNKSEIPAFRVRNLEWSLQSTPPRVEESSSLSGSLLVY